LVQLEQLQGIHDKDRKDEPLPKHIYGVLVRYKDIFANELSKNDCL